MARRKIKPCDFCESDQIIQDEFGETGELYVEFYPENNLFSVHASYIDESVGIVQAENDFTFNYCPVCGRKIGVE